MKSFTALVVALLLAVSPAFGAIYMKFDGVDGEASDKAHKGWIDIDSFSFGASQSASSTGAGGGAGKVSFQDLTFTKMTDAATPPLYEHVAAGKHAPRVLVEVDLNRFVLLQIELEDVIVSSIATSGAADSVPVDSFSLNFERIEMSYKPQSLATMFSWNLQTNTP